MSEQKQKNINIRLSEDEKNMLEDRAIKAGMKLSAYVRHILFDNVKQNEEQSDANVLRILEEQLNIKDRQIFEMNKLLGHQQQLLLNEQSKNQLLIENKKRWWRFW
ncbi:DUF536 domain-containing protein [uncultured Streptococcus sp.]|uniref:DUF536 domain-containing protein n=1 Tax=uncultured Streptococcus sp. TaxID=83427 RepID=UPI002591A894|nr:DUF536 domain-containing protein [uncultured Streptococcus sp.]